METYVYIVKCSQCDFVKACLTCYEAMSYHLRHDRKYDHTTIIEPKKNP